MKKWFISSLMQIAVSLMPEGKREWSRAMQHEALSVDTGLGWAIGCVMTALEVRLQNCERLKVLQFSKAMLWLEGLFFLLPLFLRGFSELRWVTSTLQLWRVNDYPHYPLPFVMLCCSVIGLVLPVLWAAHLLNSRLVLKSVLVLSITVWVFLAGSASIVYLALLPGHNMGGWATWCAFILFFTVLPSFAMFHLLVLNAQRRNAPDVIY